MAQSKEKKYMIDNTALMAEWDYKKNNLLGYDPQKITYGSAIKVWWICENNHEWEASPNHRSRGRGCPKCAQIQRSITKRKNIVARRGSLYSNNPNLALQWHPTKNYPLTPSDISVNSPERVWWLCEKGHEWQTKISNRTNGNNCPICIGKKVLAGYNDLATVLPCIANEWHPTKNGVLMPQDVTLHSNKKVWWKCERGHEWQTSVSHRSNGRRCPVCFGESKTSFPEQAIFFYFRQITTAYNRYMIDSKTEIDIYLPEFNIGVEYDGAYFHKGEKTEEREKRKEEKLLDLGITLIRVREVESKTCKHIIRAKPGANDIELSITLKELFSLVSSLMKKTLDVDIDVARDRYKIYEQYIQSEKDNSLAVVNPQLASEWHPHKNNGLLPEYVSAYSNKKAWWICENGHEWEAVINSRKNGVGCPYCAGKKAIVGVNDLATVNSKLASEWHPTKNKSLTASDVTSSSNRRVWWQCEKGHEWQAMIYDRSNGCGCPICSGHQVLIGYNDLATVNPKLSSEWHPTKNGSLMPSCVTSGSDKKVWWQCKNGHEWQAVISSRKNGYGCPLCAGQKVIVGVNDLATVNPSLANEWHPTKNKDLHPSDVMSGTKKKVWWLGTCGHEWEASIGSRNSGRGCPICASQKLLVGFNDLATINPKLSSEWHPTKNGDISPKDILPNSNKKFWWLCEKGHEWEISVNTRNGGHNCPYCANQIVLKGYNDLETTNPRLAREWHPTKNGDKKPSDFIAGSNKKAWWICENGHEWEAQINSRNKGVGCMVCYRLKRKSKQ